MNATTQPPSPPSGSFFTSKPFLILVTIAVLLSGGILLFKSLLSNTTLSFELSLDGKAMPANTPPTVQADGQPFTSGNKISLGRHKLTVQLQDAETLERHVWILFGRKNLGTLPLEFSKGSLSVMVNPSPAKIILRREGEFERLGEAPFKLDKLPVGDYSLIIRRGEYEETRSAKIQSEQQTKMQVDLNLGSADLSSDPADAEFELSGNGRHWHGKLPTKIEDVPGGNYSLAVSRKGWELNKDISISRGSVTTNKTEFPYSSIEVTSDPTGLLVSTNGVEIGKTPLTLHEVKAGQYILSASDGENDLMANVTVGSKEAAQYAFKFRYGTVQLASTPSGATVIRKGKDAGKTPLKLERIPAGETTVALKLDGYVTINFALHVVEGETANLTAKLVSERYVQAMEQAREAFAAGQFAEAQKYIAAVLVIEPGDKQAIALGNEVSFKIHYQKAEVLLSSNQFSEVLVELAEAEKLHPDSEDVVKLRQKIEKQKLERFNSLVQNAENSLSRGLIDEANQDLNEAEKLVTNNSKVTELRARIAPALREKFWKKVADGIADSPLSQSHVWTFRTDLAGARLGTDKALNEFLGPWKVQAEAKPNDLTITLVLEPRGIGKLGSSRACALMLSEVRSGVVEIRSKMCLYQPKARDGDLRLGPIVIKTTTSSEGLGSPQSLLTTLDQTLFNSLKRQFGQPLTAR